MKAKVLILPDAYASFVSYMKRQSALCKYQSATTSRKVATVAPTEGNGRGTSKAITDVRSAGDELCVESSTPGAEPNK